MPERKPLDPDEGPTMWIEKDESNKYMYTIIIGTDPHNPVDKFSISKNEIKRAKRFVEHFD